MIEISQTGDSELAKRNYAAYLLLTGKIDARIDQLKERVEKFDNLTAYVDRMMAQYYPEFAWRPLQQAVAAA